MVHPWLINLWIYSNSFTVFRNWMNLKISNFAFNLNFKCFDNTNPESNLNLKNFVTNFSDEKFQGTSIWEILHNLLYDHLWTNLKTIHTYFNSKPIVTIISLIFSTRHMDMKRQINMCLFHVHDIYINSN
jgi:hypothetical protein